jgi:hypothetical protein
MRVMSAYSRAKFSASVPPTCPAPTIIIFIVIPLFASV